MNIATAAILTTLHIAREQRGMEITWHGD
jgi:hypothetical protein